MWLTFGNALRLREQSVRPYRSLTATLKYEHVEPMDVYHLNGMFNVMRLGRKRYRSNDTLRAVENGIAPV